MSKFGSIINYSRHLVLGAPLTATLFHHSVVRMMPSDNAVSPSSPHHPPLAISTFRLFPQSELTTLQVFFYFFFSHSSICMQCRNIDPRQDVSLYLSLVLLFEKVHFLVILILFHEFLSSMEQKINK